MYHNVGGYVGFDIDITDYVTNGEENIITVCAIDTNPRGKASGKQSKNYYSMGCDYTRTTGIWQTVWLEFVDNTYIKSVRYYPSIIGWCPLNETWDFDHRHQNDDFVRALYYTTKAIDTTSPCIATSGNYQVVSDIYDLHDYIQDKEDFKKSILSPHMRNLLKIMISIHIICG